MTRLDEIAKRLEAAVEVVDSEGREELRTAIDSLAMDTEEFNFLFELPSDLRWLLFRLRRLEAAAKPFATKHDRDCPVLPCSCHTEELRAALAEEDSGG